MVRMRDAVERRVEEGLGVHLESLALIYPPTHLGPFTTNTVQIMGASGRTNFVQTLRQPIVRIAHILERVSWSPTRGDFLTQLNHSISVPNGMR